MGEVNQMASLGRGSIVIYNVAELMGLWESIKRNASSLFTHHPEGANRSGLKIGKSSCCGVTYYLLIDGTFWNGNFGREIGHREIMRSLRLRTVGQLGELIREIINSHAQKAEQTASKLRALSDDLRDSASASRKIERGEVR